MTTFIDNASAPAATSEPAASLAGALFLEADAAAVYDAVETTEVDGVVNSSGMQYLLASRPLVALREDGAAVEAAAVVQVFGPATSDRVAEWFGPFDSTEQVAGRTVQRSWYGTTWLDGDVAFAVVPRSGDVDLDALAAGVSGWDGTTISVDDTADRRWLDLPTTVGDLIDRGPAWTTVYAGPAGAPELTITHMTAPGEPALAKLVSAGSQLVEVRGHPAVAIQLAAGASASPLQLTWDEPDGSQVTLLLTPPAGVAATIDELVLLAGAVVDETR